MNLSKYSAVTTFPRISAEASVVDGLSRGVQTAGAQGIARLATTFEPVAKTARKTGVETAERALPFGRIELAKTATPHGVSHVPGAGTIDHRKNIVHAISTAAVPAGAKPDVDRMLETFAAATGNADASGPIGYDDGKLKIAGSLGAAVGIGGSLGGTVEVDGSGGASDPVTDAGKKTGSEIGRAAREALDPKKGPS